MFGIEDLVAQYLGNSPAAAIVAGFSVLVIVNLVLSLVLAYRSKTDNINFNILPDFIQPLLLYSAFIIAVEALMVMGAGVPALKTIFTGLEVIAVASVAIKYVKQIYDKAKQLGMPVDEKIDAVVEDKLNSVVTKLDETEIVSEPVTTTNPYEKDRPEGWYPEGYENQSER